MAKSGAIGKLVQVIGPVVDVEFALEDLPDIYDALEIQLDGGGKLVCEVQGQSGHSWVRSVAMSSTDGLRRGMPVVGLGKPITVPVGPGTLGRIFNVLGEAIDTTAPVDASDYLPHPPAGPDAGRAIHQGRGVRDRHQGHRSDRAVYQGRQDGHFWRRGRRQDGCDPGAHPQHRQVPLGLLGVRRRGRAQPRGQRSVARNDATPASSAARRWSSGR